MTSAVGTLVLRPLQDGLAGTLKIDTIRVPIVASVLGDTLRLSGILTSGELSRDGNRRVGELRHGGYRYAVDGSWEEDREGRLLRCVVGDP